MLSDKTVLWKNLSAGRRYLTAAIVLTVSLSGQGCLAQDATTANDGVTQSGTASSSNASNSTPESSIKEASEATSDKPNSAKILQGSVQEIELSLQDLRDAGISIKRVKERANDLYDEVTRQPVTMTYSPNVIGQTVIMRPTASFSGTYLPPRKKWMQLCMEDIKPILTQMKSDVDASLAEEDKTNPPKAIVAEILEPRRDAYKLIQQSYERMLELEKLTKSYSYDNAAIAQSAGQLSAEMKQLESYRRVIFKAIEKEAKQRKATKKLARKNR